MGARGIHTQIRNGMKRVSAAEQLNTRAVALASALMCAAFDR